MIVSAITAADAIQPVLFDQNEELRQKQDRISRIMDTVNGSGSLLRLATQREGHYADGIRSEYLSRLYSTSLDDIIEVK